MNIHKKAIIFFSFIIYLGTASRLLSYNEDSCYALHRLVDRLEDTPESVKILRPIVHNFIKQIDGDPNIMLYTGHGSKFYLGGALMQAIKKNKIHLAYLLAECQPDYDVRGNNDDGCELNILHFCAKYLPNSDQSVALINHIMTHSNLKVMMELLTDSKRWQRAEIILPVDLAEKYHNDKIAAYFRKGKTMLFGYTIIYVQNVEETLQFYQKAFSCKIKFFAESKLYGELETGTTILAFCDESFCMKNGLEFTKNRSNTTCAGFEIGFMADDVHAAYKLAIAQGAQPLKEPAQKPWGQIVAYIKDLNGIIIEICNPINY